MDISKNVQVGGDHYLKYGGLQPWDALEKWLSPEEFRGLLRGEALAYQVRYRDKGGVEDLKKAVHVLTKLIEFERGQEELALMIAEAQPYPQPHFPAKSWEKL